MAEDISGFPVDNAGRGAHALGSDNGRAGVPRARHCAMREVASGSAAEALGNSISSERTDDGRVELGITDSEAIAMLYEADSGIRPDLSRHGYRFAKRALDILLSGTAIVVLLVPAAVLSVAICIKSPGAGPLYEQIRVGRLRRDGTYRLFRMWKFRSMVPHADEMLAGLKDGNEADGPLFKIKDDPRIIPGIGHFIRRHSIDELPQLVNVFLGEMSLIGPRPGLPVEVVQYDGRAKRRLAVKPGCGGAWQAGGRSDLTFKGMIDADLDYIAKASLGHDLKLIFSTIRSMLNGRGAY